jgi:hypothetical protein
MIFSERPRAWAMHAMGKVLLIETQKEAKKNFRKNILHS